ncbi:hypothetical protein C0J52_17353, partial [Blattella germanica]
PLIQVPNQLVGAPTGTDVTLQCHVEASPKAINYWTRDTGMYVHTVLLHSSCMQCIITYFLNLLLFLVL